MKDDARNTAPKIAKDIAADSKRSRAIVLDVDYYQAMIDGADLTDEQKREFTETIWSLLVSFIDLGFRVMAKDEFCGSDQTGGLQDGQDVLSFTIPFNEQAREERAGK